MAFNKGKTFQKWIDELTGAWEQAIHVLDSLQTHVVAQAACTFLKSIQKDVFPMIKTDKDVAALWDLLTGMKRVVVAGFGRNKELARIYVFELSVWCPCADKKRFPMINALNTLVSAYEKTLVSAIYNQKPVEVSLPGFDA